MPTSESQKKASIKYNRSMDSITIRPSKQIGAEIRAAAELAGLPLQRYIIEAICQRMERDAEKPNGWYKHVDMPDPPESEKQNSGEQK